MRYFGRIGIAIVVGLSIVGLSAIPALASPPSGNAQAISFERSTIKAYTRVPGVEMVQAGGTWLKQTSTGGWALRYGSGWAPKGYQRVDATTVFAMRGGRITWETETLTPACPGTSICVQVGSSLEFLATKSRWLWRWNSLASQSSCFYAERKSATPVGDTIWTISGEKFSSIVDSGRTVIITGTYKFGRYQRATETDTLFARSRLVSSYTEAVSKGKGAHEPAFTETFTYKNLNHSPAEPKLTSCG